MNTSAINKKRIVLIVLLVLVLLAAAAFLLLLRPYMQAQNSLNEDMVLTIRENEDGSMSLSWPEADNADCYFLEVRRPYTGQELEQLRSQAKKGEDVLTYELLWAESFSGTECILPKDLPDDEVLTIWMNSGAIYKWPLMKEKMRLSTNAVERYTELELPEACDVNIEPDPETKTAHISWTAHKGDVSNIYVNEGGSWRKLGYVEQKSDEGNILLTFGEGKDLPLPQYGDTLTFAVDVYRQGTGLELYGSRSDTMSLVRSDLLGTVLEMDCTDEWNNVYTLTWNETKGDYYELQVLNSVSGQWDTLKRIDCADELSYNTGHLEPFKDYTFRITAKGGETLPDSEFSATPSEVELKTRESAIFCTVWPLMELEVYSAVDRAEVIGTVPQAAAYCVIDEKEGLFKIRYGDGEGYIDSNFCLINLPEYIGELCAYNITNSYSAIYMIHEFEIPKVTDTVVSGYEHIQLKDENFMMPLLYPVAQRLITAAETALSEGYRLKIYDAYRPNMATKSIYNLTLSIVDNTLPEAPFNEEVKLEDLDLSAEPGELTYRNLLEKGSWNLGNFLATSGSYHNMGIALDLTLEKPGLGEDLEMQSSMHDLSWYSVISANNYEANILSRIMRGAGFGGLTSEWWHFQDNEVRDDLQLKTFMWNGVTPECWMLDDTGWRYRLKDGSYFTNITREISGVSYTFDESGYLVE